MDMSFPPRWQYSDGPEAHPMWETEVDLERGMMRAGADKVRDRVIIAEQRGQMTRVSEIRNLLADWLPGVADAVRSWVRDVEASKGGPKPIAYPYVKAMDPYTGALVALRAILNGVATQRQKLVGLAMDIGRTCEHEERIRLWEETDPKLFYHYAKEMDRNKATATHRRRVNINRFNALMKAGELNLHWTDWTDEVRFRVGVALLDVVIRKTGWFEILPDPDHQPRKGKFKSAQLAVSPKEGFKSWLAKAMDTAELLTPDHRPTVMPPRRWNDNHERFKGGGGYWTPYARPPKLVRFKASQRGQKEHAADEYDAIDMPMVYDAIHMLQETAWRINKPVLEAAVAVWSKSKSGGIAGLPQIREEDLPPRTPRMMEHSEAVRRAKEQHLVPPLRDPETDAEILAWKRKASPIYRLNAKLASRMRATSNTILIAQQYADFPAIYFPHMLDFRGRIYPIANFLQPQGGDLARGILTFAEGLPITEENGGASWLAIQLASVWGKDKLSFEERIAWVQGQETMWRLIAADPIRTVDIWGCTEGPNKVDKPFQALAACLEWVGFLDAGFGYVSHLPIMVDGTCNGIQHLSALTRDDIAGRYVNLVPSERPQDIYKVVATGNIGWLNGAPDGVEGLQRVLERIERAGGEEGSKATYWLELTGRDLPRTLTKRQVMVLPYGGTKDSFFTYTREWLDEHDPLPADNTEEDRLVDFR